MSEQGLTWWRVELDKDGGIKTVTEVEEASKGAKLVCFVQATTRAEACSAAVNWWRNRVAKMRANLNERYSKNISAGVCGVCAGPLAETSSRVCQKHLQQRRDAWKRNYRRSRGDEVPLLSPRYKDADQAAAALRESVTRSEERNRHLHPERHRVVLAVTALKRFDELGPVEFRKWLVGIIEAAKAKAEPVAEAAE